MRDQSSVRTCARGDRGARRLTARYRGNAAPIRSRSRGPCRSGAAVLPNTKVIGPSREIGSKIPALPSIKPSQEDDWQTSAGPDRNGSEKERSMARRLLMIIALALATLAASANLGTVRYWRNDLMPRYTGGTPADDRRYRVGYRRTLGLAISRPTKHWPLVFPGALPSPRGPRKTRASPSDRAVSPMRR